MKPVRHLLRGALALLAAGAVACSLVPAYQRPEVKIPASFREAPAYWGSATPADDQPRTAWWQAFDDPVLDALEVEASANNQNIAAALAAYDGAQAVVRGSRADLWPGVTAGIGTTRAGGSGLSGPARRATASVNASWTPDLFGGLRAAVAQDQAAALASRASLGNVLLAIHAEVASDYLLLRGLDAQLDAYQATITGYRRAVAITANRYRAGVAPHADLLQAETTLHDASAQLVEMQRQRAVLEHALAMLLGHPPADFSLAGQAWAARIPPVPAILPSELLQRRPDVAAAERNVMATNAAIGVQRAAWFPSLGVTGSKGRSAQTLGDLGSEGSAVWSLGVTGLITLLDWGGRSARVDQARAAYRQAVANYRQAVLGALQQTEDGLADLASYAGRAGELGAASAAADKVEQMMLNQYLAGVADYTAVVTAQNTALAARRAAIAATVQQQQAVVALTQAIGGGWDDRLPPTGR